MSKVRVHGKSVEEAVQSALEQLQATEEDVEVNVIDEASKGFFGFGSKPAIVEVTLKEKTIDQEKERSDHNSLDTADGQTEVSKETAIENSRQFLHDVLQKMNLEADIEVQDGAREVVFDISSSQAGTMIGRRGQTLDALQYLTNVVANRYSDAYIRIVLDAENYRSRRKETLEHLADRLAKKAIRTQQKVALEPMNPAERKIIHTHLQDYAGISTKSEGKEPHRKVLVYPHSGEQKS